MRKHWTAEEDNLLKNHYQDWGMKKLALILGRTEKAVSIRAKRIGCTKSVNYWTEQELELLKSWESSLDLLAKKLGRSKEAVRTKARKIGIKRQFPNKLFPDLSHITIEPTVAAYIAGLIDGDGHVRIHVEKGTTRWRFTVGIQVKILEKDLPALKFCQEASGLGATSIQKHGVGKSPMASWRIYGSSAMRLAEEIISYSHIKRRHLGLLIKFFKSRRSHAPNMLLREELEFVIEITKLNAKRISSFKKLEALIQYLKLTFPSGVDSIRIPTHSQ